MDTVLKEIKKGITFKNESGDSEMAFVYNIMVPDFLLFTVGISFAFALLLNIFGITNWFYPKLYLKLIPLNFPAPGVSREHWGKAFTGLKQLITNVRFGSLAVILHYNGLKKYIDADITEDKIATISKPIEIVVAPPI